MSPETKFAIMSLVIGASIGFVFSTISAYIAYRFQLHREEINRKWEIENKQREIRREILAKRLREAEEVIELYYSLAQRIADFEYGVINSLNFKKGIANEVEAEARAITKGISSIVNIGDQNLVENADKLRELSKLEIATCKNLINAIVKRPHELDKDQEKARTKAFIDQATVIKTLCIKRIDEILSKA